MEHYICKGGCKTVAENSGLCEIESCAHHGQPLVSCSCTDDMHFGAFQVKSSETADEDQEIPV